MHVCIFMCIYYYMCTHTYICIHTHGVLVSKSCPTLCDAMDCSPVGSSVHGILQERILEWVAMPSSRGSPQPRDQTHISYVSCVGRGFFTTSPIWEAQIESIKGIKDLLESLTIIHSNVLI